MKDLLRVFVATCSILLLTCCSRESSLLRYALHSAGDNRPELEAVLAHYSDEPEKLAAARFLIAGLPAHYSYKGDSIYEYYNYAAHILSDTLLSPEQQRDTLLAISDNKYSDLPTRTISDAQIITSNYLIKNIDQSYLQWQTCPWARQLTFDEYIEWLLPYKAVELQELDAWRDTLQAYFGFALKNMIPDDDEYLTTRKTAEIVRNAINNKILRYALYTRSGLPLISAYLLPRQTFGDIPDYVRLGALIYRSLGIPVAIDETPVGPRDVAAVSWFTILSDRGEEVPSPWDISSYPGMGFFPEERGPKVYRNTYAINPKRMKYQQKSKYQYPFDLGKKDVTDLYFLTSDIELHINTDTLKNLKDRYTYIASATICDSLRDWEIVDFGIIRHRRACFDKMGREVLYVVYGYDGIGLVPVTAPFILHKDGHIEYINTDTVNSVSLDRWRNKTITNQ
ncbi:MAG TPA: hypothetical protein VFC94_06850 [Bacteroidaceae bacterium]|nr:hypothetical protein [Bacteroidaceae bacterium]